ncbi:MAG: hypothetical protein R3190_01790 [Thermoanaerobaculia bacterium]|nr:hypothetical protein [Thermoanaerobaculia bacterium]
MPELVRPDGAIVHYEVTGSGPPLLALGPVELDLRPAFTVVAPDDRYEGASRAPLAPFSYEQAVGDHLAVLDQLGLDRVCLVAAGLRCPQALRLMYDAPVRIAAAALVAPVGLDQTNTMDTYFDLYRDTIRRARAEGLEGVVAAAAADPADPAGGPWAARLHAEPAFRDSLLSLGRETYIALVVDFRDGMWPWAEPFFGVNEVALGRIDEPVLVVPGDDPLHPRGVAEALCRKMSRARLGALAEVPAFLHAGLEAVET